MLKYIVRRILIFIPTLFAISLIAFLISTNAPGDPVDSMVSGGSNGESGDVHSQNVEHEKDLWRHRLGLDLPVFYFSFTSLSESDTMYRVHNKNERDALERLVNDHGNWNDISAYYLALKKLKSSLSDVKPDSVAIAQFGNEALEKLLDDTKQEVVALLNSHDDVIISSKIVTIEKNCRKTSSLGAHDLLAPASTLISEVQSESERMKKNSSGWKNYVPCIHFYPYNQYHRWLFGDGAMFTGHGSEFTSGAVRGDFGTSYSTKSAVTKVIARAIPWSLFFTILSVLLAYLVSIPIGVQAASKRGGFFDRTSSVVLFMLFSLPTFFMATLLLMTFANPDMFNWFQANGVKPATGYPEGISAFEKLRISIPYLVLPLVCYTYSSLAFLSRTMRVSILEVINQDFIRTARAKGLPWSKVVYKHALRNALLPIITVFSNIFPAAVGGSVILEFIFGIPGMGQEIVSAIYTKDYTMIVCVFTLSGFMTLIGYLVADILYAFADPRISFSGK